MYGRASKKLLEAKLMLKLKTDNYGRTVFILTFTSDSEGLKDFFEAMDSQDAQKMQNYLNWMMDSSISYMDKRSEKENFYHGMILGMLNARKDWTIKS
ncbi:hypothetical protein P261_02558 [Lachnospiraceae bacterium TWA4]|nr:hypothetical protein P261_02558 [Lachnospiraceae bacterium TWA4]